MITTTITVLILVPVFFELIKKRALWRGTVLFAEIVTSTGLVLILTVLYMPVSRLAMAATCF